MVGVAVEKIDPEVSSVIFKPVLIRAGISLIFAVVALIIQQPSPALVNWGLAVYLLFAGTAMWEYLRRDPVPEAMRSPLSMAAAAWCLGAFGLVGAELFETEVWVTALIAGAAYLLGGVAELVAGLKHRAEFIPARDQLITGAVNLLAGAGLLIWMASFTVHQVMGLTGSVAFVITVITAVSGVGFWLDVRKARQASRSSSS